MFSGVNAEDLIKGQGWKCEKRGNLRGVSNNIDGRDGVSKYNGKISFEVYPHPITTISSPLGMFVKIFLHSLSLLLLSTWWITTIENTGKNFKGNPLKLSRFINCFGFEKNAEKEKLKVIEPWYFFDLFPWNGRVTNNVKKFKITQNEGGGSY